MSHEKPPSRDMMPFSGSQTDNNSGLVHRVTSRLRKIAGMDRDAHTEKILASLSNVQAETARTPGAVGRLGRIVDSIRISPPEGTEATRAYSDEYYRAVLGLDWVYPHETNRQVHIKRTTAYDYHPVLGRVPPGYDEITVDVLASKDSTAGVEIIKPNADIREVGIRIRPDVAGKEWLIHGRYQVGDWDGHPGTQYAWEVLNQESANAFLDQVFGREIPEEPTSH